MRSGRCFEPPTLELPTVGIGSSSLLGTPRATRGGSSTENQERLLPTPSANLYETERETWEARRERQKALKRNGNGFGLTTAQAVQLLPTPTAGDAKDRDYTYDQHDKTKPRPSLSGQLKLLPTPRVSDANGGGLTAMEGLTSERLLPTPQARDYKGKPSSRYEGSNVERAISDLTNPPSEGGKP